ncbi:MAG: xanthine dehydrogenase family protein subunit M [Proteobacteria bacterium]|nr:xanthine dehydrogenase family protein subunit M [Pseudomonadota bacterium]
MYPFDVKIPTDLAAARKAFEDADDGLFLAGGQTLIPVMKQRLAMPGTVIALERISDLAGIKAGGSEITIGAMTRHAAVAADPDIAKAIPALAKLAGGIGDPQVRNRGTIGGSLANNDPAADYPAAALGLGATIITDKREIAVDQFFKGMFETALDAGEIITAVRFPMPECAAYVKLQHPATRFAMVGVMVAKVGSTVRVAVTGAAPSVFRATEMEAALTLKFEPNALDGITIAADGLNNDIHASREYRAHLIGVLARRAAQEAIS